MACLGFYWEELAAIAKLSYPTAVINTSDTLMNLMSIMMLGFYGTDDLAAGAVGIAYFSMIWYFMEGFLTAQDSLAYQSFALRQKNGVRYWTFISLVSMAPLCAIATLLLILAPYIIPHYMAVEVELARRAGYFAIILVPTIWTLTIFRVLQKYLQAQNIMKPSMICGIGGLIVNFLANFMFIFIADGGYVGCAASMFLTRLCMLLYVLYYITSHPSIEVSFSMRQVATGALDMASGIAPRHAMFKNQHHIRVEDEDHEQTALLGALEQQGLANTFASSHTRPLKKKKRKQEQALPGDEAVGQMSYEKWRQGVLQGMKRFAVLGLPGGIILGLELWSFDIGTILASFIGPVTLSAHKLMMLWTVFLYISIPFSLATTASIRIASLLAAQNSSGAALTSRIILMLGVMVSLGFAALTYHLGPYLGYLFSSDADTRRRVALLAPAVAIFQLTNALQPCAQGILRGCGMQGIVVWFNFLSMWVFGFPAGLALAFYLRPSYGINGLWYGYTLGIGMQTIVLVGMIANLNWDTEVRKARLRIEHLTQDIPDSTGGSLDALAELNVAIPRPGSRAAGGFLFSSELGDEYLDEFDRIEITELYDPRVNTLDNAPMVV